MKRQLALAVVLVLVGLALADSAEAGRRRVVVRGPRGRRVAVVVRPGFPIRRTLPVVVVRPPLVAVAVAPAVFLPPVAFGAVVVSTPPPADVRVWKDDEDLDREDGWTEFTMNVDKRGSRMLLEIEKGAAQLSFAEVVFENGETRVVDFDDKVHARGTYDLLDFKDGRKVDHVRVVAKAETNATEITLHLLA
jgi:hypothetical protein